METGGLAVEDGHPDDIGRQQVAGELDALKAQAQRTGQCMGQRRFPDTGQILDQQVTAGEQAGERESDLLFLAQNDPAYLSHNLLQRVPGRSKRRSRRSWVDWSCLRPV